MAEPKRQAEGGSCPFWEGDPSRLLERFGEAIGVPVLLNTPFNLKGEPIVNTPADVVRTFRASDMDALGLDDSGGEEVSELRMIPHAVHRVGAEAGRP